MGARTAVQPMRRLLASWCWPGPPTHT